MPKKIEITLDLHKCDDDDRFLLLDGMDITEYIPDTTEQGAKFAMYIDKWCQYLNRTVTDNNEMAFGNVELARLEGWITGYGTAKGYTSDETHNSYVVINAGLYVIKLSKPFKQ